MGKFIDGQLAPVALKQSAVTRWHVAAQPDTAAIEQVVHALPHQEWVPHWHDELSVGAVVHGCCEFSLGGRLHRAAAGDLLSIAPGAPHTCAVDSSACPSHTPVLIVMIYVSLRWLDENQLGALVDSRLVHHADLASQAAQLHDAAAARDWLRQALPTLHQGERLSPRFTRPTAAAQRILSRFKTLVHSGEHFSVDRLAAQCAVSRKQLHRTVRRWTGMSPDQYQRATRIHHGRALLLEQASVAEAAQAAGFADQAHFTRWYRRVYGYTPGAWVEAAADPHL